MFIAKASGVEKISNMLNQWQIQGRKNWDRPPPLSQGLDERPLTPPPPRLSEGLDPPMKMAAVWSRVRGETAVFAN